MRKTLRPRSEIVGPAVEIEQVIVSDRSQFANNIQFSVDVLNHVSEAENHPLIRNFTPPSYRIPSPLMASPPDPGVATWPSPPDLPVGGPFMFIAGIGNWVESDSSRRLWFELEISLRSNKVNAPLIGGICFTGYPYLPYYIDEAGVNSSNFGLPREWRVTWEDHDETMSGQDGFIDRRTMLTRQVPAAHTGVYVIPIGATRVRKLKIRLGDFPRILLKSRDPNQPLVPERWGVLIPYLSVFEHRDGIRTSPRVGAGIVAAIQSPPSFARSYIPELSANNAPPDLVSKFGGVASDFVALTPEAFAPYSAASIFGQSRDYSVSASGTRGGTREVYVSNLMEKGDSVIVVVAQAETFQRTIAGVRLRAIGAKPPPGLTETLVPFDFSIYELDTVGGASPVRASIRDPAKNKYALKLYSGSVDDPSDNKQFVCAFDRPSNAAYFVIEMTPRDHPGHVGLGEFSLVRSAHAAAVPRPSKEITIRTVNLRLIGPGLADDYSSIGESSLGISVERQIGGAQREIIFEAKTLLDLLDRGGARLYRNQRFFETEREVSRTISRSDGWRRSELGDGVTWTRHNPERGNADERWPGYGQPEDPGFTALGNVEQRTHMTHVGPEGLASTDDLRGDLTNINKIIRAIRGPSTPSFMLLQPGTNQLTDGFETVWHGVDLAILQQIRGVRQLNLPPFPQALLALARLASAMQGTNPDVPIPTPPALVEESLRLALGAFLSGGSVSLGVGASFYVGGNIGVSLGQTVPFANRTVSKGETGSIQLQGSRSGYQLRHAHNGSYDDGTTVRRVIERNRKRERGAEIRWQGGFVDILTAKIPINMTLPAAGSEFYENTDQTFIVRITNDSDPALELDVWIDVIEEEIQDDY